MKTLLMTSTKLGLEKNVPRSSHRNSDLYSRGLKIKSYSEEYKNYSKVMIVRNPYQRLVSAYQDKFRGHYPPYVNMKKTIIKSFSIEERAYGFNFSQFVNLLQGKYSKKLNGYKNDRHWKNYDHMCTPCLVPYDFILRTEAMSEEVKKYILPLINRGSSALKEHTRQVTRSHNNTAYQQQVEYFEQLSGEQIRFLKDRFRITELMYGYGFNEDSLVSSCELRTEDDSRCC